MEELHLQRFLRGGGTFEQLEENWGIKARRSEVYSSLVLFKYDQINSPMAAPIVQECRGIILDSGNNWEIVAFPFRKFFNYGEPLAAEIDWDKAEIQEKCDGSLITMYWYGDKWNVATSGNPDAAGPVNDSGITFNQLFWKTWNNLNCQLPEDMTDYTFMFELMTPYNRIVVHHKESIVVLIGVRNRVTGLEEHVDWHVNKDWPVVKNYALKTIEDIVKSFDVIKPLDQEGYIVLDKGTFNRVKVKHPGYVALHHMKDSLTSSKKYIVDIVRKGETTEFLVHFPEFRNDFDEIQKKYHSLAGHLMVSYQNIANIETQKDFAAEALRSRVPDCLFRLRKGATKSVGHYLAEMSLERLMEALER